MISGFSIRILLAAFDISSRVRRYGLSVSIGVETGSDSGPLLGLTSYCSYLGVGSNMAAGFVGVGVWACVPAFYPCTVGSSSVLMEIFGTWSKGTKPLTSKPSNNARMSMRISSIFWLKSTMTGITFAAVTGFFARLASNSLACSRCQPAAKLPPPSFGLAPCSLQAWLLHWNSPSSPPPAPP